MVNHLVRAVALPSRWDAALAAVLAVAVPAGTAISDMAQADSRLTIGTALACVAAAGISAWHPAAPMTASVVIVAIVAVYLGAGGPYGPIQLLAALACYTVARRRAVRVAVPACTGMALVLGIALWTRLDGQHLIANWSVLLAWSGVFAVIPALVGRLVQVRAEANARERANLLARGAYEERLRVAREVHDIAGHGFAVVAMQAGVALTVFDERPEQARLSLQAISTSSQHALRELQSTLDDLETEPASPHAVPELVERMRAGGQAVEFTVTGDAGGVDPSVGRAVYRTVREALTNVVRHAGRTTAEVTIDYSTHEVTVEVRDHGAGQASGSPVEGRGLRGTRDRIESLGGIFTAGNHVDGGFVVAATIPQPGASS